MGHELKSLQKKTKKKKQQLKKPKKYKIKTFQKFKIKIVIVLFSIPFFI
jgi:hypothetical protein